MAKPKAKPKFSSKDLVRSLEEIMRAPEHAEGMSYREIRALVGKSGDWVRSRLQRLHDEGKLEVAREPRESIDGVMHPVPVYRLRG